MRTHDWPERLQAFFQSRRSMPFSWGSNDCALFAADAVLAQTGEDPAADHRGYADERTAIKKIQSAGGLRELVVNAGLRVERVGFAQRGWVSLALMEGRETLGVVVGNGMWAAPGANGMEQRPMSEVIAVFAI